MKSYAFPGNIEDDILAIGARQVPYMRTQEFSNVNLDSERLLLDFIGCKEGKAIIYTGSGTGAMDAVVSCYITTKQRTVVIDGGSFGHRWVQLCDYYNCPHYDIVLERGHDIDYEALEQVMIDYKPDAFLVQHHETSTGQLYNLPKISELCKKYNVSLVVDAISSFLVEDLNIDELGIDLCITSSQKGLNIPPGLSILFIAKRLVDYPFARNNYYFEFQNNLDNLRRGQTPFSPATQIFLQLNARLHQLQAEGVENHKRKVAQLADYFAGLCKQYGWAICAHNPSKAITGFQVNGVNKGKVFRALIEKYDTFVMPGSVEGFLRVSHMGEHTMEDLTLLAQHISEIENGI